MTQSKLDKLWYAYASQSRSVSLLRWLGYSLLLFAFLDLVTIVFPPRLFNPEWEFQAIGEIIERVPVPLIGLVMVFWGEQDFRRAREGLILKILTWMMLLMAILLLGLIPLCFVDAMRLHQINTQQVGALIDQRRTQVQQLQDQLQTSNSVDQMQDILNRIQTQRQSAIINDASLAVAKEKIPTLLEPIKVRVAQQDQKAQSDLAKQGKALLKRTLKWSLSALITAVLLIRFWQGTRWARKKLYL
ncbi:MAG: hypothetical protein HC934_03870 [Acaryochloridaceae cyanobacterium SU_2_1]|nr:hypothetical protein [Acaryochloridaceae cyanobacterium SU_2_1]